MKITILINGKVVQHTNFCVAHSMASSLRSKGWAVSEMYDIGRLEFKTPWQFDKAIRDIEEELK